MIQLTDLHSLGLHFQLPVLALLGLDLIFELFNFVLEDLNESAISFCLLCHLLNFVLQLLNSFHFAQEIVVVL